MEIVHTHARVRGDPQDWDLDWAAGSLPRERPRQVQTGSDLETCPTDHSLL
jgi:hypothetical protein